VASVARDGQTWRLAGTAEVAWIKDGTVHGFTIDAAIPLVFDAYATVVQPDGFAEQDQHDRDVLALLRQNTPDQPWWLGYLDTGTHDIVFPGAPMVRLYAGWPYVLVEAGPEQAATWRRPGYESGLFAKGGLPDLMFPADRSWLFSTLWDDDWSCVGGPGRLVADFLRHPDLEARRVFPGADATPPGHTAF
jgi:hypothetical protein